MEEEAPNETGILTEQVAAIECHQCGATIDVSAREPFEQLACPECGAEQKVPARFGPFLLLDLIGRGGMGGVYLARDESLGRPVAIKVMLQSVGEDEALVETFKREARSAARLNHPNVAQIYSFGQEHGQPYIVMELIRGKSLDILIEESDALDQTMVMRVGHAIAEGLHAADEVGLVHGDIKPENILFDSRSRAKLVDFGIATFTGQADAGSIWGTPYYISPEKIRRQTIDARSDIYSLGATLYHALAGRPPFEGETPVEVVKARLNQSPEPLRAVRSDIDEEVERIVERMLELEPGRRYPTYASLLGDMKKVLKGLRHSSVGTPSKRIRIKKRSAATVGAAKRGPGQKKKPKLVVRTSGSTRERAERQKGTAKPVAEPAKPGKALAVLKGLAIGCLSIILLVAVVGGAIYLNLRRGLGLTLRREQYELAQHVGTATNAYRRIEDLAEAIRERATEVARLTARTTNAVSVILEEPLGPFPLPPPPDAAGPAPAEPAAAEPDATNLTSTSATAPAAEETLPPEKEEEPRPRPRLMDLNVSLAELPEAGEQPEARRKGWDVLLRVHAITTAVARANQALAEATERKERVLRISVSTAAAALVEDMESQSAALKELSDRQRKWIGESRTLVQELRLEMQLAVNKREAARIASQNAQRAEVERQRKEREREAQQAKLDQELASAATAGGEMKPLLDQNDFAEAAQRLKKMRRAYETDEGRAALDVHIDRYARLQKLKTFLIAELKKEKMPWGYGFGATAVDVVGADAESIHIRGSKIAWPAVSTAQMVKFLNHFLSGKRARRLTAKTAAEQNVAAAVYCFLHGGTDAARTFADEARRLDFRQGETLRQLGVAAAE